MEWSSVAKYLDKVLKWLKQLGVTPKTFPSVGNNIIIIVASLMCFPEEDFFKNEVIMSSLKRWCFSAILSTQDKSKKNHRIVTDFVAMYNSLKKGDISTIEYSPVYLEPKDIIDLKAPSDSLYQGIQILMCLGGVEDLKRETALSFEDDLECHHIFPKALKNSGAEKDLLESVANKLMTSRETNRELSAKNPDKYIVDLARVHRDNGTSAQFDKRLKKCFIPYLSSDSDFDSRFEVKNIRQFLEDRSAMIIERIKEVVGNSWSENSSSA